MHKTDNYKLKIWRKIYPVFVPVRDFMLRSGMIHHSGRQPFLLGHLIANKSVQEFRKHMEKQGFFNHFVAWTDDDQLLSLRKLVGSEHQYHLRLFKDKELRGHYEKTPESHPIQHYYSKGQHPKTEEFLHFLGDWLEPSPLVLAAKERVDMANKKQP